MANDLTKKSPLKQLIMLSLPMILGSFLQQIYLLSDAFVVGNFINAAALAAIGAATPILFLLIALILGLCMGLSVVVSQYFGAKDFESIKKTIASGIVFLFFLTLAISLVGFFISPFLLELLSTPKELLSQADLYLKFMFLGLIFMFLYDVYFAVLYGLGNAKIPLYILFFTIVLNIILDIVFIVIFKMNTEAVAIATTISQFFAAIIIITYVNIKIPRLSLRLNELKIHKKSLIMLLKFGIPSALQQSTLFFGLIFVQVLVNSFGTSVIAGYTAASRIDSFIFLPYLNLSTAISVFVGQNIGAKLYKRAQNSVFAGVKLVLTISAFMFILIWFFSENLMKFFLQSHEFEAINIGKNYLLDLSFFYVILGISYIFFGFLRGIGDNNFASFTFIISLFARVIFAYILVNFIQERGIWISAILGWMVALAVCYGRFRSKFQKS